MPFQPSDANPARRGAALCALLIASGAAAAPHVIEVSATAGSPSAADALLEQARRHEHGVGAPQNLDRALKLYCEASARGVIEARYQIGWLYLTGRLGPVDEVLAAAWLQSAAAAGHAQARLRLGQLDALDRSLGQVADCVARADLRARRLPARAPRVASAAADPVSAGNESSIRAPGRADLIALVRRLAPDYGLEPELVLAVIEAESNFDPLARSAKNAQGLMQLIPATAARFKVDNVWDPLANLRGGMAYLRWLLDYFDEDLTLALAGYNAGEQAVVKHGGVPPFAETQGYVKRILRRLGRDLES